MLRPLLLIGLGGSGGKTLRAIKQVLQQNLEAAGYSGGIPAAWQFLQIDTTYTQGDSGFPTPMLAAQEFYSIVPHGIHSDDLLSAIENATPQDKRQSILAGWGVPSKPIPINTSPSQKRADARQAGIPRLSATLQAIARSEARINGNNALAELIEVSKVLNFGLPEVTPQVFIFTSIGGSSGSGLLVDVAEVLKAVTSQFSLREAISFLYTPDVFSSIPRGMSRSIPMNALGAMNELIASRSVYLSKNSHDLYYRFGTPPLIEVGNLGCHTNILVGATNISNDLKDQTMDEIILKFGTRFGKAILEGEIPNFLEEQLDSVRKQSSSTTDNSGLNTKELDVLRSGGSKIGDLPPIWAFAPLTESILEQVAISKNEPTRWAQFWDGRRSRPLVEAIPFATEMRRSIITGWFVARFFGLVEIDFEKKSNQDTASKTRPISDEVAAFLHGQGLTVEEKDRQKEEMLQPHPSSFVAGRTVRIWNSTLQFPDWSTFPSPLLPTHQMDERRHWVLPQLLASAGIALAEFGKSGNPDSIAGYRLLKYLGREVTTSVGVHDRWDGDGAGDMLPTGVRGKSTLIQDWVQSDIRPVNGPELKGPLQGNLESQAIRMQAILKTIDETRDYYQSVWKELEDVRWQDTPETWEIKDDIDLALTSIYEYVEKIKTKYQGGSTIEEFNEFFEKEALDVPMVAAHLQDRLIEHQEWHWATQPTPAPIDDYGLTDTVEYLKGPVRDQYSVSHSGYGLNSYSLNFRHVSGELAMIMQCLWGGAYGDREMDSADWNRDVRRINPLLAMTASESDEERVRKYLIVASNFRLGSKIQFLERTGSKWEIVEQIDTWEAAYDYLESVDQDN